MRIELRKDVFHKQNEEYYCLLVQFETKDTNFFQKKSNWMPKSTEMFAISQLLMAIDPKYRRLMLGYLRSFEVNR